MDSPAASPALSPSQRHSPSSLPGRDHLADADTSHSRKRPRLSDELDTPPAATDEPFIHFTLSDSQGSSAQSPTIVELPQEQSTDPSEISIIMPVNDIPDSGRIDAFPYRPTEFDTAETAAEKLAQHFQRDDVALIGPLEGLFTWLQMHLQTTEAAFKAALLHGFSSSEIYHLYTDNVSFWNHIVACFEGLTGRHSLAGQPGVVGGTAHVFFESLLISLLELGERLLHAEVAVIAQSNARRDSTRPADSPKHSLIFSSWATAFLNLVVIEDNFIKAMSSSHGFNGRSIRKRLIARFQGCAMDAIVNLVTDIVNKPENFNSPVSATSHHLIACVKASPFESTSQNTSLDSPYTKLFELFKLVHVMTIQFLPKIHLDDSSQRSVDILRVFTTESTEILLRSGHLPPVIAFNLIFKEIAEHPIDQTGLIVQDSNSVPPNAMNSTDFDKLQIDDKIQLSIMACELQYFNALIQSSSVELRIRGTEKLGNIAMNVYQAEVDSSPTTLQTAKDLTVRFLLSKGVVTYLFGPQSHAALIARTCPILSVLTAMQKLTKVDADALWNAFTNVQQPDNAQSTYHILFKLVESMQSSHMSYFCNKYRDMLPSQFTKSAELLLRKLLIFNQNSDTVNAVESIRICISLFDKIAQASGKAEVQDNQMLSLSNVLMTLSCPEDVDQQIELVELCAKPIISLSDAATGHLCALTSIIQLQNFSVPPQEVLSRLSFRECVEEFVLFLDKMKLGVRPLLTHAFSCHIDILLHLLTLSCSEVDRQSEQKFWDHLVGEHSISQLYRDYGWRHLELHLKSNKPGLEGFYQRCISQYLPTLTPDLVSHSTSTLFALEGQRLQNDNDMLLPMERDLLRFALLCPSEQVSGYFTMILNTHLFQNKALRRPDLAVTKQVDIVRQCIARLSLEDISALRAASLLLSLLYRSQDFEKAIDTSQNTDPTDFHRTQSESVGDNIQIPIRIHKGNTQPQNKVVMINKLANCSELDAVITSETGFANYTVISAGQKIDFTNEPQQSIKDIGVEEGKPLIVQKRNTLRSIQEDANDAEGNSAVENELLSHLDILYGALDEQTPKAQFILQSLMQLKFPGKIRTVVASTDSPFDMIFPPQKPLRVRASMEVLHIQLTEQIALGVADENFLLRGVHLLIELLHHSDLLQSAYDVYRAAEILLAFLRERPVNDDPEKYFKDANNFTRRILLIILAFQQQLQERQPRESSAPNDKPFAIRALYQCLLESLLLSSSMRTAFLTAEKNTKVHQYLLMTEDEHLKTSIPTIISTAVRDKRMTADVKSYFSRMFIHHLVPAAETQPTLCGNIYPMAVEVLSCDPDLAANESLLRSLIDKYSTDLLNLDHWEEYGSGYLDLRVQGLINLFVCCVHGIKNLRQPLNLGTLASQLFTRLLFPVSPPGSIAKPVITLATRKSIYDLLMMLCEDDQVLKELSDDCMRALLNAALSKDFNFSGPDGFIRPERSCSGLKNLSQTCYMNSLIQQLFMNIQFRRFILEIPITQPEDQAILKEFQLAFAHMQDSYRPAFEPEALAKALDVDVTVQDDAHIFFTTLIGRLEDNMPNDEAKKTLKAFFGGVNKSQTVGSCKHVSESTDEYFNLSLVVKDKSSLEESLDEYVKGAVLEGGDKFKCTTCGSGSGAYVDAVRRTALDHIPDNLVLGLKRFRYETYDGGAKVNDRFDFPERIDMSRYKLSHLAGSDKSSEPDIFQLVGVVVHWGTLQFGHYWSYAAERGRTGSESLPWFKLEDRVVTRSSIEEVLQETRGGPSPTSPSDLRADNAYVLFYQRVSSVDDSIRCLAPSKPITCAGSNTKASLPLEVQTTIAQENEWLIHILHLFARDHLDFVRGLAGKLDEVEYTDSAAFKDAESKILTMLYRYYIRVFAHSPYAEPTEHTAETLQKLVCSDTQYIHWLLENTLTSRMTDDEKLILHKKQFVRQSTSRLVLFCLATLREKSPATYGIGETGPAVATQYTGVDDLITNLLELVDCLPESRVAWPEYFELVSSIAEFGMYETQHILESGTLCECLEILMIREVPLYQTKYMRLNHLMSKGRKYDFASVAHLVYTLLHKIVDLRGGSCIDESQRVTGSNMLLLSQEEHSLLSACYPTMGCNVLVDLCMTTMTRPQSTAWQEWSVAKLAVLLTDPTRVTAKVCDNAVRALLLNLRHATSRNSVAEIATKCLISRKMTGESEEFVLNEMRTTLQATDKARDVVPELFWMTQTIFHYEPSMILPHLPEIIDGLLSSDYQSVEKETTDWLKASVLCFDGLVTPLVPANVKSIQEKMEIVTAIYNLLGTTLDNVASKRQKAKLWMAAVDAWRSCAVFLKQVADTVELSLNTQASDQSPASGDNSENETTKQNLRDEICKINEALTSCQETLAKVRQWVEAEESVFKQDKGVVEEDSDFDAELNTDESMSDFEIVGTTNYF